MKLNSSRIASILLVVSVLLCLGTMFFMKVVADREMHRIEEMLESHEIFDHSIRLLWDLRTAEAALAGYMLTEDEKYLASYNDALDQIDSGIQTLFEITIASPGIQALLADMLIPKINEWRARLNATSLIFEQSGRDAAFENLMAAPNIDLMDAIQSDIRNLKVFGEQSMVSSTASLNRMNRWYDRLVYTGLLFISLSIVFGIFLIRNYDEQKSVLIRQMGKTNIKLARLNKQEVALREKKNFFLEIAAHDLRHPLYAIVSLAKILKQESASYSDEHKTYIDYIIESTEQMNTLIDHFLDTHDTEEQKRVPDPKKINIKALIKTLLFKFKNRGKQKDISIMLEYELPSDTVVTDKSIFSQVVDNLLSNAIKFSPKQKKVIVRLKESESGFDVEIEDEGYGIKESEKEKLFKKYQTLSTRPTDGESSKGLGLSIAYEQMKQIGGEIFCKSEEGKGATFIAKFPQMEVG